MHKILIIFDWHACDISTCFCW